MDRTSKKLVRIILIAVIVLFIIAAFIHYSGNTSVPVNNNLYDATESIERAKGRLTATSEKARIVTNVETSEKVVGLTFKGLSDTHTNNEVLDLLKAHETNVNFFLPAILASEDIHVVERIADEGHKIGSNSLSGALHMDKYKPEELVEDFSKANCILSTISDVMPSTMMLNSTTLTDDVLRAAYACGNEKVVESTSFINDQSFKNYDQVLGYVKRMEKGSILTIKMDGVLEEDEYKAPVEVTASPIDKKPGIESYEEPSNSIEITQIVEWILKALEETGYKTVFVEDLHSYKDLEYVNNSPDSAVEFIGNRTSLYPWYTSTQKSEGYHDEKKINGNKGNTENKDKKDNMIEKIRLNNDGKKAVERHTVYTTEQALSYTFYGIGNRDVLDDVLNKLDVLEAKGTFYVTERDVREYGEQIKAISDRGHEIGICLSENLGTDYYSVAEGIINVKEGVKKICGQNPVLVRYAYDVNMTDEALEAVSSLNCSVIWQDLSIASSKLGKDATIGQVMNYAFNAGNISARRGNIIYYRMDYYKDPSLVGDTMLTIARDRIDAVAYKDGLAKNGSEYALKSLGSMINGDKVFNYPLQSEEIVPSVKDVIYDGHLTGLNDDEKSELFNKNYIGNPSLKSENTLPGFSPEEIAKLNNTGRFTDDKTIFLTFDDWSSDKPINQILYVLNKYDVKASFYIRTNHITSNPNLLRAIAEEGHDIGSHTDMHLPYATTENIEKEEDTSAIYYSLTPEEVLERKEDLLTSYNKLQYTIGDVEINGKPALSTVFRPPTLAMSKSGMEAIFDMGFTHILSGDFSTHDYEETDSNALADKILNGIQMTSGESTIENGSVLVMHMSDDSSTPTDKNDVTAETLDIIIPKLLAEGYRFEKVSDCVTPSR